MPKYLSPRTKRYTLTSKRFISASQKGQSTVYIILIIVVIIFAVMLAGGGNSLFTGNEPTSVTDEPTPSTDPLATTTPDPSTPAAAWSIDIVEGTCQTGKSAFKPENITAKGSADGTLSLEIENPVGTWKLDAAIPFHSPSESYTVKLDNATGYNTKNWRIKLTSGGSEKAVKTGSPTGC